MGQISVAVVAIVPANETTTRQETINRQKSTKTKASPKKSPKPERKSYRGMMVKASKGTNGDLRFRTEENKQRKGSFPDDDGERERIESARNSELLQSERRKCDRIWIPMMAQFFRVWDFLCRKQTARRAHKRVGEMGIE